MYRCRRFVAIFLSLAVIASFFSFSSFAEDDIFAEFNLFVKWNDGSTITMPVHNGSSIQLSITDTEFHNLEFSSIQFKKKPDSSYCTLSFDIHFYYYPTSVTMLTGGSTVQNVNMDFTWYQCTLNPITIGNFSYFPLGYAASLQTRFSTSDANRTIGSIIRLKAAALPQNTTLVRVVIDNVRSNIQLNFVLNYILDCQNTLLSQLFNIVNYSLLMLQRLTENNEWSVSIDYFDGDGNFVAGDKIRTTWYNAIYQLLSNLYTPVKEQAEQEQRAKEAGALDALDEAYDKADDKLSFWSFLDLIDIGDIGEYDDEALGFAGSDSIIDWFSNATKNDIEGQVINPLPKDNDHIIIDFYGQNIDQIQNYFGGG